MNAFRIDPVSLLQTLSMALDLAVSGIYAHQSRTAVICGYIAEAMKLELGEKQNLLIAALMHDIGAAPNMDERLRLIDPHEEEILGPAIYIHAEAGFELLKDSSRLFNEAADSVRYHHDAWAGGNPSGLSGEQIPLHSRIINVADRAEVLTNRQSAFYEHQSRIPNQIKAGSGTKFDPAVVEAFVECSQRDTLWLDLSNPGYYMRFLSEVDMGQAYISAQELIEVAHMFAGIIDRTSIFTASHSRNVAKVSVLLGSHCCFNETELYLLNISGLLHDLGKLSIPNSILEKPGKLDERELAIIRQHPYYTYRILERIDPNLKIAQWAAYHHETLTGDGYPFRLKAEEIPLGSKIVAVADIFVAIAENRPYRTPMDTESIFRILIGMCRQGKIEKKIVEMLLDDFQSVSHLIGRE